LLDVLEVRHRRNHIASADFSALFGVGIAKLRMHYDSMYNRIKFYLVSAVAENVVLHIFRKKSTCHYLDFVI
ncbi:hypothetical protein, partial [Phascolarctobacterium succinatutens]|uniref:hypothetical protein n=1 Tax=Phascolarctobacterium succinatutens TaxID=626940 RepID=UPI00307C29A2